MPSGPASFFVLKVNSMEYKLLGLKIHRVATLARHPWAQGPITNADTERGVQSPTLTLKSPS